MIIDSGPMKNKKLIKFAQQELYLQKVALGGVAEKKGDKFRSAVTHVKKEINALQSKARKLLVQESILGGPLPDVVIAAKESMAKAREDLAIGADSDSSEEEAEVLNEDGDIVAAAPTSDYVVERECACGLIRAACGSCGLGYAQRAQRAEDCPNPLPTHH